MYVKHGRGSQRFGEFLATLLVGFAMLAIGDPANAHVNPPGCVSASMNLQIIVQYDDGSDASGATFTECETIKYHATICVPGIGCSFEGGPLTTWTITTPDGAVHDVMPPGGIPLVTSGGPCADSLAVSYPIANPGLQSASTAVDALVQHTGMPDPLTNASTGINSFTAPCGAGTPCAGTTCDPTFGFTTGIIDRLGGCKALPVPLSTPCEADNDICTTDHCDGSGQCVFQLYAASGTPCRTASGVCDLAEACTGSSAGCPPDAKSTAVCRAAGGTCDAAEICPGDSDSCPPDALAASGVPCRATAGACDLAESCTGISAECPADAVQPSGLVCRAAVSTCDVTETCDGSSPHCPLDAVSDTSVVCRVTAGVCDRAETCDGSNPTCPLDGFAASGTTCRAAGGPCDAAETCSGSGGECPPDGVAADGTVCRAESGECDVAEVCSGTSKTCAADAVAPSGQTCRAATSDCDIVEACTGALKECPTDATSCDSACAGQPDGTACDDGNTCTGGDECAQGTCQDGDECVGIGIPDVTPTASPRITVTVQLQDMEGAAKRGSVEAFATVGTAAQGIERSLARGSDDAVRVTPTVKKPLTKRNQFKVRLKLTLNKRGRKLLREAGAGGLDAEVVVTVTDRKGVATTRTARRLFKKLVSKTR